YCTLATKPCTLITVPSWYANIPKNAKMIPGSGLTRTIASILGASLCGCAALFSSRGLKELEIPQLDQATNKLLEEEELEKVAIASKMRVEDFRRELNDGYAYLHLERNPHLVEELTKVPKPESALEHSRIDQESPVIEAALLTVETKIPQAIQMILDSDLKQIVDAGIINLVGAQGSGKSTTSCMMLRYRVWRSHRLVIVNPHKRKSMYRGLEAHLEPGTTFYGVGMGDEGRATSLMNGLEKVLALIGKRYDEYQHLDENQYNHYPITILLEECAEYDGLLSIFNRPPNKATGDEGFSAKKYLTNFWKKLFIASRKGNCFVIRTIQSDTNTTNGTEGLAELIKSSGACTLTQFSVPDGECIGGWRSTGEGEIKIPNQKYFDSEGNTLDANPVKVPTYWDYATAIKDVTDFSDLIPPSIEPVSLPEPQPENPEDLWERAIEHLKRSFATDTNTKSTPFPPKSGEVPDTKNHLETVETKVFKGEQRYTPDSLSREELLTKIRSMLSCGDSQTKIIENLWKVEKNRSGWKQAYKEFKELNL
ncbi:hypothetical protein, partial [Aetokthonos hydrillicola]